MASTVYYPELSRDIAMRIGGEHSSEKVTGRNFVLMAEEAGHGQPLVRSRVAEMSEKVIAALPQVEIAHPVAEPVAALIRQRSQKFHTAS